MNSDYTYRSCPGCGFDSCICEHVPASEAPSTSATQSEQQQHELHAAQHTPQQQQNRPIKIKLNLASSILPNTNKSPPALLPVSHGSAVPTPHTKQLKKRGRPPKTGRFALPHSHSRGAYNPRGRAGPTSHKSNIAKAKHGAVRRGFASNKKKGGRGSYRHDDDDYYYDGSFPTFVTAISSSSEDDDDEMDEELAVYHHRAPPVVPAPVTGPRLGKELLVPSLPHQDDDDDEEDEEDDQEEDDSDASSDLTDPDDISIQASEERFIIAEERARVRRELMGQDDVGGNGHKQRFDWQATPSKRSNSSSSGGSDSDSDSESSSDEDVLIQDEDDDNAEDEAEADVALGRAATTPLAERSDCSSDSDDFDAAVFFASLDSDHEEKAAEADDDEASTVSDLNVPRMQDSAYPMPIVSQDGMLAFGDPLAMLDAPFDIPTAVPSPNYCGDTTESDDDDEQMDVDTDQGATEDEDGFGTDDGETTDDMDEDEIAEILAPRFATPPPQGVDPLALHLTPIAVVPQPPVVRRPTPPRTVAITPTTRPRTMSLSTQSISSWGSMSPPAPPALRMPKLPSMGRFESPAGPVPPTPGESPRVVVIDGTSKDIPSPFARKFRSGLMRGRPKVRSHDPSSSHGADTGDYSAMPREDITLCRLFIQVAKSARTRWHRSPRSVYPLLRPTSTSTTCSTRPSSRTTKTPSSTRRLRLRTRSSPPPRATLPHTRATSRAGTAFQ